MKKAICIFGGIILAAGTACGLLLYLCKGKKQLREAEEELDIPENSGISE